MKVPGGSSVGDTAGGRIGGVRARLARVLLQMQVAIIADTDGRIGIDLGNGKTVGRTGLTNHTTTAATVVATIDLVVKNR